MCPHAHPDLHSFPTRRSSDLHEAYIFSMQQLVDGIPIVNRGWLRPDGAKDAAFGKDRKSTRLNSSHVAISYAVFCLKKKNICGNIQLLSRNDSSGCTVHARHQ